MTGKWFAPAKRQRTRTGRTQILVRVGVALTLIVGLVTVGTAPAPAAAAITAVERGDINTTGTNGTSVAVADSAGSTASGHWTGLATPSESVSNVAGFVVALKPAPTSAIAFRSAASSSTGAGSGVTSFSATAPSGIQAGDLLIAFQGGRSPGTVTPPHGWTLGRRVDPSSGSHWWYWKIAGSSEPSAYTWNTDAATKFAFVIVAYSGVDASNPIHAENGHITSNTGAGQRATPTLTTSASTWLVQAFAHRSTHTNVSWHDQRFDLESDPGTCGDSGGSTICVATPGGTLSGSVPITVTNSSNRGRVFVTWIPSGGSAIPLITKRGPSPGTNDYSFIWPTHKYLDASGVLHVRAGSTESAPVAVAVTLSNGNVSDFQHSPNDWANYLPTPSWTASRDPVVATVGDGASDEPAGNNLARSITESNPDLFLYLGDIYEDGTFTENLNHYGQNSMDGGTGTLWGAMGAITQPTIGNHETLVDWLDYWHGRPLYDSFRFGNVLFFNLASDFASMGAGSAQYNYVKNILESTTSPPPPCIVTFFHRPTLQDEGISFSRLPMWSLLTNNGGDLVLNGHSHSTVVHKPLNDQLQLPSPGEPTMVQMIFGAGGTGMGSGWADDPRIEWKLAQTPGATYITLNGARKGGTPTSLTWTHKDTAGNVLRSGTRDCGEETTPSPLVASFSPTSGPVGTSVTITGSGLAEATQVAFNGTLATFSVNSDTEIIATVPNATTGPITVTTPVGTATSDTGFTVTGAPPPGPVNQAPVVNAGPDQTITLPNPVTLNGSVTDDGLPDGAIVTQTWSAVSTPAGATVTFANPNHAVTTATFSAPGIYVLRLTATDTALTASDDVTVRVGGEHRAVAQSTRFGTLIGALEATYFDDGIYQSITEQSYGGGSRARLEHTWSFQLGGGDTIEFVLNAFGSGLETFTFDYSTDGRNWTPMVVVTAQEDGTEYRYTLPSGVSGTVFVRVMDDNRDKGDTVADVVRIDRMVFISRFN